MLESAIFAPRATFDQTFLHKDIFDMAAAYACGIIKNHPFIDGNKRTGIIVMLIFLKYNGHELNFEQEALCQLGISIAKSKIASKKIASLLRKNIMQN